MMDSGPFKGVPILKAVNAPSLRVFHWHPFEAAGINPPLPNNITSENQFTIPLPPNPQKKKRNHA